MTGPLTLLLTVGPLTVLLAVALRRENGAAVVNTAACLLVTLVPVAVDAAPGVSFSPVLTYWVGGASVLHCVGMLGWYESVQGWDHLAHTVSAALAAALLYAGFLVATGLSAPGAAAATLGLIVVLGVLWELLELLMREVGERHGIEPVLIHYGWRDTALDMVFDVVGVALVLVLDLRLFVPVFETLTAAV